MLALITLNAYGITSLKTYVTNRKDKKFVLQNPTKTYRNLKKAAPNQKHFCPSFCCL